MNRIFPIGYHHIKSDIIDTKRPVKLTKERLAAWEREAIYGFYHQNQMRASRGMSGLSPLTCTHVRSTLTQLRAATSEERTIILPDRSAYQQAVDAKINTEDEGKFNLSLPEHPVLIGAPTSAKFGEAPAQSVIIYQASGLQEIEMVERLGMREFASLLKMETRRADKPMVHVGGTVPKIYEPTGFFFSLDDYSDLLVRSIATVEQLDDRTSSYDLRDFELFDEQPAERIGKLSSVRAAIIATIFHAITYDYQWIPGVYRWRVPRADVSAHVRAAHLRCLRHPRYYQGQYAHLPIGSRWVQVKSAIVGRAA